MTGCKPVPLGHEVRFLPRSTILSPKVKGYLVYIRSIRNPFIIPLTLYPCGRMEMPHPPKMVDAGSNPAEGAN